jgi:transcriptional/translational regulatory protein YebC/TACO1
MEQVLYEAYGPGGVAILISGLTENRNKAAQEVKHILSNHGIELASQGSAAWAFEKTNDGWRATTTVPLEDADIENLSKLVDELEDNDEVQEVFTNAE